MTFDLIITTYNRPDDVNRLVSQSLECCPTPEKIIIVDSSDEAQPYLQNVENVRYIRSSHKNQPYQRLLGASASIADIVVFFDDDLLILRKDIFNLILMPFNSKVVIGSAVAFQYENRSDSQDKVLVSPQPNIFLNWFWQFTGVPFPAEGQVSRLGVVGKKPVQPGFTETFNGANMAFYRSAINKTVPAILLSLTERKLCMGEDKVISMLAIKGGKLFFNSAICLQHPCNKSTYFQNIRRYYAKVTYSRLYLSQVYSEVLEKTWWKEVVIYHWFTFWRFVIAGFSLVLRPSSTQLQRLLGIKDGWWFSITLPLSAEKLTPGINWEVEIQNDLAHATNNP